MTRDQNRLVRHFADGQVHGIKDVCTATKWGVGRVQRVVRELIEAKLITMTDGGWRKQ